MYAVGWKLPDEDMSEPESFHDDREAANAAMAALQQSHTDDLFGGDLDANPRMYWVRAVES